MPALPTLATFIHPIHFASLQTVNCNTCMIAFAKPEKRRMKEGQRQRDVLTLAKLPLSFLLICRKNMNGSFNLKSCI